LLAVSLRWPVLIIPTLAVVLTFFCDRCGLSVVGTLTVTAAVGVGVVLGIVMALVATSH
jgi:hypothetical protein